MDESCWGQFSVSSTKISGIYLSPREIHSKPKPQEKLESAENGSDRPGSHS